MKFNEFRKSMCKNVFTWEEARRVAWQTSSEVLRLELFQWRKRKELILLKRGVYAFPDRAINKVEIARELYPPSYVSLEWALHEYGLIPDVVFAMTLVSSRGKRRFVTPMGEFVYHKIRKGLFFGFDPDSLLAVPEKALVDYFYFFSARLVAEPGFWNQMRWQNLERLDFRKAKEFATTTGVLKILRLVESLELYAKT